MNTDKRNYFSGLFLWHTFWYFWWDWSIWFSLSCGNYSSVEFDL